METNNRIREEMMKAFDEKYPNVERWHYDSYVEFASEFMLSKIDELLKSQREELVKIILENVDDDTRQDLESYKFIQDLITKEK